MVELPTSVLWARVAWSRCTSTHLRRVAALPAALGAGSPHRSKGQLSRGAPAKMMVPVPSMVQHPKKQSACCCRLGW